MCTSILLVEVGIDAEALGARAHDAQRRLDRLLHHVAELAGMDQLALARHDRRFDAEQVAADFGPGETRDETDLVLELGAAEGELAHAEVVVEILRADADLAALARFDAVLRGLAAATARAP